MRRLVVIIVIAVSFFGAGTSTNAQMLPVEVDLGGDLAVRRLCTPSSVMSTACWGWSPIGFSFGDASASLPTARMFARSGPSGAIVAVFGGPWLRRSRTGWGRMMRTTDGGRHWTEVTWSWPAAPMAIAFDGLTRDGVAVGEGYVWSTSDGGARWVDHGSSSRAYVSVAIAAGEIIFLDAAGTVSRSDDHGFARDALFVDPTARLEQRDTEILVHTATSEYVVRRGHGVRRTRR